jgi:SAM-dependent methyltransferase
MTQPEATLPFSPPAGTRDKVRRMLRAVGYDTTDWIRVVMYRRCFEFVRSLKPELLDVLEIAAGPQWCREFSFKTYTPANYPDYDVCEGPLPGQQFDLIIADQVFEHLKRPYRAGRHVYEMLRAGGYFVVTVPFLVRLHDSPIDCSRWTETGLSYLLQECGFAENDIQTEAWGNRACIKANFKAWRRYGWYRPLANEPNFPVVVWAFARKPTK